MKGIRELMYTNIHGCNKHLTREHLEKLFFMELLANTHPIDRPDFKRKLEHLNLI